MKSKLLLPLVGLFAAASLFGTAHSAWASTQNAEVTNVAQVDVPTWNFGSDSDFARIDGVRNCSYLTPSKETSIVNASAEAVRLTNTAGTQTKAHSFILDTDREYTVGEIKFLKVEFDYYHAQKRQQAGRGLPKVQLVYDTINRGSDQGGTDSANDKSPFIVTDIDENWWHMEYFVTAMVPTMADHGDTPIGLGTKINGIKITDSTIYDYGSTTAFIVVDNMRFSSSPSPRLGLFNRTTAFNAGGYYWMKVCWSGELHSCVITFDDDSIAEYTPSEKSPFYIKGLKAGTVVATATLTVEEDRRVLSISNTLTVN